MKKKIFVCFAAFAVFSQVFADSTNWVDILKDELEQEIDFGDKSIDNVRETKIPGDHYTHIVECVVEGSGTSVKKTERWWYPDTKKRLHVHHTTQIVMRERIVSNQSELEKGTIKSVFYVQQLSERLGSAKGDVTVGLLDSKTLVDGAKALGELLEKNNADEIADSLFAVGLAALFAPEATVTKLTAAGSIAAGLGLKALNWFLVAKLPSMTDAEGHFVVDKNDLEKYFPSYEKMVYLARRLEGSQVETTWEWGKGYTKIDIQAPFAKEEDKKLLAKIIMRANPVGARSVVPKDYENKEAWTINAADIGSMIMTVGVDYNLISGFINVVNAGISQKECPDELRLRKKAIPVCTLRLNQTKPNDINFQKKLKGKSTLRSTIVPKSGEVVVAVDDKAEKNSPVYVREMKIVGELENEINHGQLDGLLKVMHFEKSSVKLHSSYLQVRDRDDVK